MLFIISNWVRKWNIGYWKNHQWAGENYNAILKLHFKCWENQWKNHHNQHQN